MSGKQRQAPSLPRSLVKSLSSHWLILAIWEVFRKFCKESNIHGVRHIFPSQPRRGPWLVRLFPRISGCLWLISVVACFYCGSLMIRLVLVRFWDSPIITVIDSTIHPIYAVPFPSVTICNTNKVYGPFTKNLTSLLKSHDVSMERILVLYQKLPSLITLDSYAEPEDFNEIRSVLTGRNYTAESLMMEVTQPCENLLQSCVWGEQEVPCGDIFRMTRSSEGFCCSFNYNADSHSREELHVAGAGRTLGLEVVLDVERHDALALSKPFHGVEVLIHDPEEFPQGSTAFSVAVAGGSALLAVVPTVTTSRESLRSVALEERQCYFPDEKKLRATNKYTLTSCLAECRVDFVVAKCNCTPFYYPDLPRVNGVTLRNCGLRDISCLRRFREFLSSIQPPEGTPFFNTNEEIGMECACLPGCSETTYEVETISLKKNIDLTDDGVDETNLTTLSVYFKDTDVVRYRREVFMTWDSLFDYLGGVFGLCLGGSILSLVEAFYLFTVRLPLVIWRRRKENREEVKRRKSERKVRPRKWQVKEQKDKKKALY